MASKNVETLRAAHESWNRRDFQGIVRNAAEGLVYTDHARDLTLNNRDKFREWTEAWAKGFSDGHMDCVGRLLLRSIHAPHPARARPTARRSRLEKQQPLQKARCPTRLLC